LEFGVALVLVCSLTLPLSSEGKRRNRLDRCRGIDDDALDHAGLAGQRQWPTLGRRQLFLSALLMNSTVTSNSTILFETWQPAGLVGGLYADYRLTLSVVYRHPASGLPT